MFKMQVGERLSAKGIAIVKYPMHKISQFLMRDASLKQIDDQCQECKTILKTPEYNIVYLKYAGMWPVAGRDFITISTVEKAGDGKLYIATSSCNYPYPGQPKLVRAQIHVGGFILEKIN